jgi:hypothetical protein
MQTDNSTLIEELLAITERSTEAARRFKALSDGQLQFKKRPEQWSILECIEHLNLYGDFYLPAIEKSIVGHKNKGTVTMFKSGLLGNYFANLMKAKDGKIFKMKTPADKNPLGSELNLTTIDRFLKQQGLLKSLLNQARQCDLTHAKVPISLAKFMKLRLGDTFRFFVYHIERHVLQAEATLAEYRSQQTQA